MAFTFQDLFSAQNYAKNVVVVGQILSLRVNTLQPADIVVSDLCAANAYDIHENSPAVPPDNKKSLIMYKDKLAQLVQAYRDRTGADLFEAQDVDHSKSSFIDLFHKYCFVRLRVRLAVGRDPSVTSVELVTECPQFDEFWEHFRPLSGRVSLDRELLLKMVQPALRVDQYSFLLVPVPLDSTSYSSQDSSQVKIEPEVKSEAANSPSQSYAFFSAVLQPSQAPYQGQVVSLESDSSKVNSGTASDKPAADSNGAHVSPSQYSDRQPPETQLFFPSQNVPSQSQDLLTQVPQTMDPDSQFLHHSSELSTQESHLDFDSSRVTMTIQGASPGRRVPLSYLNDAVAGDDVYKVQAKIVGTVPSDLCLVCTKSYVEVDGEVELSDPKIRPFDIILSDSPDKLLTSQNSLCVQIPNVLSFFGYKHTEQLYTRMDSLKKDFAALCFTDLELHLSRNVISGAAPWALDTSLKSLQLQLSSQ